MGKQLCLEKHSPICFSMLVVILFINMIGGKPEQARSMWTKLINEKH